MPNVKQVDFDLNAINNELTGEASDLHREIMPNLIEGNPYEFKIVRQPKNLSSRNGSTYVKFSVDVVGLGVTYAWQYKTPSSEWNYSTQGNPKTKTLLVQPAASRDGYRYRCVITDKFGNTIISEEAQFNWLKPNA